MKQYKLTIEELDEIGHCVLADSITHGDNYDVETTITKWLMQYRNYKQYLRAGAITGSHINEAHEKEIDASNMKLIKYWLQFLVNKTMKGNKSLTIIWADDEPKKKLKPNCSKCHLWEESDISYYEREMYCSMRKCLEKEAKDKCKHSNNVRIPFELAQRIHLQSTGHIYKITLFTKDRYHYLCIDCHVVFPNYT